MYYACRGNTQMESGYIHECIMMSGEVLWNIMIQNNYIL